jgi:SAM-dependent methyltransferase
MTFDGVATAYDTHFTHTPIARWLRERVWSRLEYLFQPGMRVLELGCGTGEDAVHLAKRGIQLIATDASPKMLEATQAKAQTAGVILQTHLLDLNDPTTWQIEGLFDGVYSNFGALNCTPRWLELGTWLAEKTRPGAHLGFGVMGRFCLWETVWHGLHLEWRIASRRWSGQGIAILEDGTSLKVFYPTIKEFRESMGTTFEQTHLMGLGVFLPSTASFKMVEARPNVQKILTRLETSVTPRFPWYHAADHFWLELGRR